MLLQKKKKHNVKYTTLHIDLSSCLDINFLYDILFNNTEVFNRYTFLFRVSYKRDEFSFTEYKMLGEQIPFYYESEIELKDEVKGLSLIILKRFEEIATLYNIKESEVLNIQIIIYKEVYSDLLIKKQKFNIKSLGDKKDLINVTQMSDAFNKLLPLTTDKDFGSKLNPIIKDNSVKELILSDNTKINFVDKINKYSKDKLTSFSQDTNFYQRTVDNNEFIIISNTRDDLTTKDIDLYNINGMKICSAEDKIIDNNNFIRKIGNVSVSINESGIYNKEISCNFDYIKPKKLTGVQASMLHPD